MKGKHLKVEEIDSVVGFTRPQPYSTLSFEAFRVTETRTFPLAAEGSALPDFLASAQVRCFHKDKLLIRETDTETGTVKLHLYAIKKKAPKWIHPAGEIMPRRVEDLYADPLCIIDGQVLDSITSSVRLAGRG